MTMKTKNSFLRILVPFTVLLPISVAYPQANSISQQIGELLRDVQIDTRAGMVQSQISKESPRFSVSADGYLRHLGAPPSHYFPVTSVVAGSPEATARNFLAEHGNLFGVTSAAVDFRVLKSKTKNSRHYVRFQQTYAGLPVFAAEAIVQLNALGGVDYVISDIVRNVKVLDDGTVSLLPLIAKEEAITIAKGLFSTENPNFKISATEPHLTIFDPSVLAPDASIHIVWDMTVYSEEKAYINEHILLDAHSGEAVRRYPLNIPLLNRQIFDASRTTADPGTLRRSEGGGASGIADVDDAYDFFGDTYNFYNTNHQRDGINGSGMVISATVRYCPSPIDCPWQNAWWSWGRNRLYFGEGMAADDVVGHEYTHGVTDYESALIYENHSGAINESFSDIWGEFIDLTNGTGTDTPAVRWKIGEDCSRGILRDMRDPSAPPFGHPDRLRSTSFVLPVLNPNEDNDWGGVHTNSGVNNKLCYLLTDGDTFNGHTVAGMGIESVAALYYEVQGNLLLNNADYYALGYAFRQATVNLSWSPQLQNNVHRACVAVEMTVGKAIYVDKSYSGPQYGTKDNPFKTVAQGLNTANPGDYLFIKGGSYNEIIAFGKTMWVWSWDNNPVTIGQ